MADKSIEELREAEQVRVTDLLLVQQSGEAKKVTGQTLIRDLAAALDGHGGINRVEKASSGLNDTYTFVFADGSTYRITLTNGKSISTIAKVSTSGLTDTYRISYNDGTSTTFAVKNGEKGDTGAQTYVHIRWSAVANPSASDMSDYPDAYIGVYTGLSATAPSNPQEYRWYQYKGSKGDKGDNATVTASEVAYQVSDSGTVAPSGSWVTYIPTVAPGKFLWARTTIRFNTGSPVVTYNVARFGIDGTGSVVTVNNMSPDPNGNVQVTAADVGSVSTRDVLDFDEIEASTDLSGKVASAQALKDAKTGYAPTTLTGYTVSGNYVEGAGYLIAIPFPNANLFEINFSNINAFGVARASFNEESVNRIQTNKTNCFLLQPVNKSDGGLAALHAIEYTATVTKKV